MELNPAHPNLIALHGFLGEAADWKQVFESLKDPGLRPLTLEYTQDDFLNPEQNKLSEWGESFARWFAKSGLTEPVVLAGYSQGGRLALQALKAHPELVRGIVVVSSNPGFLATKKIDRDQRRRQDEIWAQRFEQEDWNEVCTAWNSQSVFQGGSREPVRVESAKARSTAAASLRNWSLSDQEDFRELVQSQAARLIWAVGERDLKYRGIAGELKSLAPALDVQVIPSSGHRVPFDSPLALAALLDRAFAQFGDGVHNP